MNSRERFRRMLCGERVDRPAWAFWRHYPHDDFQEQFVSVHVADLLQCNYDLWRISLPSAYAVLDYGVQYGFEGDPYGRPVFYNRCVTDVADWKTVQPLEMGQSEILSQMLSVVREMVSMAPADRPVQVTLFSPLTQAARLCGGVDRLLDHLSCNPALVLSALEVIAETTRRFAAELVRLGVDGFFFAVQECSVADLKPYTNFLNQLNRSILQTGNLWLNTLHLHGEWDSDGEYRDYPVAIFHWDTQASGIDLVRGSHYFPGIVSGGLNWPLTGWRSKEVCMGAVFPLLEAMQDRPYMFSCGCVLPYQTSVSDIRLMGETLGRVSGAGIKVR
jgi:uroporphyrinogen decarboxylase